MDSKGRLGRCFVPVKRGRYRWSNKVLPAEPLTVDTINRGIEQVCDGMRACRPDMALLTGNLDVVNEFCEYPDNFEIVDVWIPPSESTLGWQFTYRRKADG